jgi:hypothetical protein
MAQKAIHTIKLTDTLALSECKDGWWLYDKVVGMNLGIRCKSPGAAFVEALTYYQKRLTLAEENLKSLSEKVERFVDQFAPEDDRRY